SSAAGHLMIRDASNGLPAANAAINFDQAPFITKGKGPTGQNVEYYNFDVQSVDPAPIYVLFKEGSDSPVPDQMNIIDVIPGETGYNDFWLVNKVTVPANYAANEVASLAEIQARGYAIEATTMIVNCPVVPEGSTATKRLGGGSAGLMKGWYKEKIVSYFTFGEKAITALSGKVPTSPIYVCFNINADQAGGGPASGFKVEPGTMQTHNVVATIPSNGSYSPLWLVNSYDNAQFDNVGNLSSAQSAPGMNLGATVNCPVVSTQ
ncbi:MAG: hypothetical protein ACOYXT_21290, partial [Bacteroidota bacterium]